MDKVRFVLRYFRYYFTAGDAHSIHSPFIFDFYQSVVKSSQHRRLFDKIEARRKEFLSSEKIIQVTDLGAGSKADHSNSSGRKISRIAKHAEKSPELAQLLFRITEYFKPEIIFDLGTSLGLTTLYLAAANQNSRVYTFEGCPETMRVAEEGFKIFSCDNIFPVLGNIDHTLPEKISMVKQADLVFFDANHRYEPTIRYFNTCLQKAHEESVFIFDDIHWSEEMEKSWEEIKNHPEVTLTIDLFYIGIVFFRKKQPKQHFKLK